MECTAGDAAHVALVALAPEPTGSRRAPRRPTETATTMTLLVNPPTGGPTHAIPPRPATPTRPRPSASLLQAVSAAIAGLDDVDGTVTFAIRRRIDRLLRDAVDGHLERIRESGPVEAVPAVRVACAYLAAGDLEDAYLALLTARDLLR